MISRKIHGGDCRACPQCRSSALTEELWWIPEVVEIGGQKFLEYQATKMKEVDGSWDVERAKGGRKVAHTKPVFCLFSCRLK